MVLLPATLLRLASDDCLVGQLRAGSDDAFEVLFDRHHKPLLAFCRHMLGSTAEAEDVVQDTFLAAHRGIVRSSQPIAVRPWLYTIARRRCISVLRARREQPVEAVPERATSNLAAQVDARDELRALLTDVGRLPEAQRAALVLAELGELSHEQIASVVGCPQQKVRALVFQARSNLAAARAARDTPCREIRQHIAMPVGGGVGRSLMRRHLAVCEGCREFRDQVRQQRRGFASLLPVGPALGLKASVLGTIAASGGGGTAAVSGGALLGGGVAATSMVAVALVGGATNGVISRDAGARAATPATADALVSSGGHGVAHTSTPAPRPSPPAGREAAPPATGGGYPGEAGDSPGRDSHPGPAPAAGPPPAGALPSAPQQPTDANKRRDDAPDEGPDDPAQRERGVEDRDERPAKVEPEDGEAADDQQPAEREDKPQKPKKDAKPGDSAPPAPDDEPESRKQPDKPERSDKPPKPSPEDQPTEPTTPEPAETVDSSTGDEDSG
jgi:RNA polymerase sigma factor (sigma-70 family)